jgi:hypothetical protein
LKVDRDAWESFFKKYHSEVYSYFENRKEDLLVIDVTKGDDWEKLCPFLELPIPSVPFPKSNVASIMNSYYKNLIKKVIKNR